MKNKWTKLKEQKSNEYGGTKMSIIAQIKKGDKEACRINWRI